MKTRVLLVDDEKDFVETLAQRLEIRAFEVKTAFSGNDALSLIMEHDFDVIVLDVLMPEKDGIDTLKEIKNMKPLIIVIMLTGHATAETATEGMKLGAYDYLIKPTGLDDLISKITMADRLKKKHEKRICKAEIEHIIKKRGW